VLKQATHDKADILSHIGSVPFLSIENPNTAEHPRTPPNGVEHGAFNKKGPDQFDPGLFNICTVY
jgi:hypothetical protein